MPAMASTTVSGRDVRLGVDPGHGGRRGPGRPGRRPEEPPPPADGARRGPCVCGQALEEGPLAPEAAAPALSYRLLYDDREIALRPGENLLGRVDDGVVWIDSPSVSRRTRGSASREDTRPSRTWAARTGRTGAASGSRPPSSSRTATRFGWGRSPSPCGSGPSMRRRSPTGRSEHCLRLWEPGLGPAEGALPRRAAAPSGSPAAVAPGRGGPRRPHRPKSTTAGSTPARPRHPCSPGARRSSTVHLTCRAHNRLLAEVDYGREPKARHRSSAGGISTDGVSAGSGPAPMAAPRGAP